VQQYLTDDEYGTLQQSLIVNPEAGDVIPGSGGVRKLRWGVASRGIGSISSAQDSRQLQFAARFVF
jgi:hypothetical protein